MNNTTTVQNGTSNLRLATAMNLSGLAQHAGAQERVESFTQSDADLLNTIQTGDPDEVKALLAAGADANVQDGEGWTALMLVIVKGHLDVARELLNAGADIHAKNHKGWTALRFAVSMDDDEALRLLLEAGADVNEQDDEGDTALMQAAREKSTESLRLLLAHEADVNVRNSSGETALKIAARHGYHEIISALKDAGADDADAQSEETEGLFSEGELLRMMEKLEGLTPFDTAADNPVEQQALALGATSSGVLERLAAALEALRPSVQTTAPAVSVADAAHKLTLSLPEASALSGLSRNHIRQAIKGGNLDSRKIGRGRRIKRADLEAYVSKL